MLSDGNHGGLLRAPGASRALGPSWAARFKGAFDALAGGQRGARVLCHGPPGAGPTGSFQGAGLPGSGAHGASTGRSCGRGRGSVGPRMGSPLPWAAPVSSSVTWGAPVPLSVSQGPCVDVGVRGDCPSRVAWGRELQGCPCHRFLLSVRAAAASQDGRHRQGGQDQALGCAHLMNLTSLCPHSRSQNTRRSPYFSDEGPDTKVRTTKPRHPAEKRPYGNPPSRQI